MRFLHAISSVDPAGGGPWEGIRQLALRLRSLGHDFDVVCMDDPRIERDPASAVRVFALGPPRLGRYSYAPRLVPWLREHLEEYDSVVVNGLWQYHGFAVRQVAHDMGVPYCVFPHGMLDPWFRHAYPLKHVKKWLYWPWGEYRVLRDAAAVLFTCEEEKRLAPQSFSLYRVNAEVVPYGTACPPGDGPALRERFLAAYPDLRDRRLLLFLSRIHEKKGCDLLIDAFARIAPSDPALHLVMAGPDQTGWKATLVRQAERLGIAERISWPGLLQGDLKWGAFYASEAMCLPSHQENFGIVVAEALGCGLPVLISNKVNIWREIEAAGAGLVGQDTSADTEAVLRQWLALDAAARTAMGTAGKALFASRFTIEAMADRMIQIAATLHSATVAALRSADRASGA